MTIKSLPAKIREFEVKHPKARVVAKGMGYLLSERMVKFILGFFIHALMARHLGPNHFGKLSYIIKTVNIFYTFSLFGVDEIILRHLMGKHYRRDDVLKTVFKMRLGMGCVGLISLGGFILLFNDDSGKFALLTFLYGVNIFLQAFNLFELNFHSSLTFKPLFWSHNISYFFSSGLRVLGVFMSMGVSFFLSTYLLGEIILKALIQRRLEATWFSGKYLPELARSIFKESWPYFISSFIVILDQRLSFLFIEKYRSLEELGNYSVAVTLVDLWLFLPAAVCSAVFPTIVTAHKGQSREFEKRIQYLSDVMVWLGFLFFIGVSLTSNHVINLLYGNKYENAPSALVWYASTTVPVFFNLARVKIMALNGKLIHWMALSTCCFVLNLIGHSFLVDKFGVQGAIGSFLLSQLAGNLLMALFLAPVRHTLLHFVKAPAFPFKLLSGLKS